MKTTVEIPDRTYRRAKSVAAATGITLKRLVAEAVEEKLRRDTKSQRRTERPWTKGFGGLADLKVENARMLRLIKKEFEQI